MGREGGSMKWVVLKFGGTSVSSLACWQTIGDVIEARISAGLRPVVVCSAISGISNELERLLEVGYGRVVRASPRKEETKLTEALRLQRPVVRGTRQGQGALQLGSIDLVRPHPDRSPLQMARRLASGVLGHLRQPDRLLCAGDGRCPVANAQ